MKFKIGFMTQSNEEEHIESSPVVTSPREKEGVKSLVQVYFHSRNMTLTYYNDRFDLRRGDMVYVDGRLAGQRGRVVDIAYNFKIKPSKYQKVVSVVNTDIHGDFYLAGSHFLTFDPKALPKNKILPWFLPPDFEEEEFVSGDGDDLSFLLDDLTEFKIEPEIAKRGYDYYTENRVRYISLDGNKGYAIVEGSEGYEVEFTYEDGRISHLICRCFCSFNCKHEFAVLLQLRDLVDLINNNYSDEFGKTKYFAAICKSTLFCFAIDGKEAGSIRL